MKVVEKFTVCILIYLMYICVSMVLNRCVHRCIPARTSVCLDVGLYVSTLCIFDIFDVCVHADVSKSIHIIHRISVLDLKRRVWSNILPSNS